MRTNREIAVEIQVASLNYIQASGAHAKAHILATTYPRNEQFRTDARFHDARKKRAFADLVGWCCQILGPDSTHAACNLLSTAISNADLQIHLVTTETLNALARSEAA